jgi:hypothetical protein
MFIQISNTKDLIEVLNIAKIVKIFSLDEHQVRINMVDGTYTVTHEDIFEIHESIEFILGGGE